MLILQVISPYFWGRMIQKFINLVDVNLLWTAVIDIFTFGIWYGYLHYCAVRGFEKGVRLTQTQMLPLHEKRVKTIIGKFEQSEIAIVIPLSCTNMEQLQDFCITIDSLKPYPGNIVVCVDGPSPYLHDIITLSTEFTCLISVRQRGSAFAMNRCIEHIQEFMIRVDRICLLDVGVTVDSKWWETVSGFNGLDYIVTGPTTSSCRRNAPTIAEKIQDFYNKFGLLNPRINKETREIMYGHSSNLVIPKAAFHVRFLEDHFPDAGYEDIEYCIRLQTIHGFRIAFCKELKNVHLFREKTVQDMEKRFYRYGRNFARLKQVIREFEKDVTNTVPIA
jgi:hypothetical protein